MNQHDIELPDDITVQRAIKMILDRCKKGYFYRGLWREGEYFLCSGDCGGCSGRRILEFLLEITKVKKKRRKNGKHTGLK